MSDKGDNIKKTPDDSSLAQNSVEHANAGAKFSAELLKQSDAAGKQNEVNNKQAEAVKPSEVSKPTETAENKEHKANVEAVQGACEKAGQCAKTLDRNGQDSEAAYKATLTAPKGSVELALQHAAILISKNKMPADPTTWTSDQHDLIATLATQTA